MKRIAEFIRHNLLLMLFLCLIIGQLLMWRALVSIEWVVNHYGCGTYSHPCRVIIVPEP